jgi:glyoxylase-like metal-dependent hydrolase (beta-lactamase superfamily II)
MSRPVTIDTKMHGRNGITGTFLLEGDRTALIETGPKSSVDHVLDGLNSHGVRTLDWIIVTHIHLDHAGAAGTLAGRFPEATIAVHPVGAPHLVDPSKLWSSAARIYGDAMESMWGGIDPIPRDRLRVLEDGDRIDLGGTSLRAVDTPGHAYHHHAYLDESTGVLFAGDALGVRLPDVGLVRPATPPPEFHLEKAIDSIERIDALNPAELWLTHYGPHDLGENPMSVSEVCAQAIDALRHWEDWVRRARKETGDLDAAAATVKAEARGELESRLSDEAVDRMEQTTSYRMNTWGYMRYLDKLET